MGEDIRIELTATERGVRIVLHDRVWATSADPWDQDALHATIALRNDSLEARCDAVLWAHEFVALRHRLASLLQPTDRSMHMHWASLDGTLAFTVSSSEDQLVHLAVTAQLHTTGLATAMGMHPAPAHVVRWITEIDGALIRFPTRAPYLPPKPRVVSD